MQTGDYKFKRKTPLYLLIICLAFFLTNSLFAQVTTNSNGNGLWNASGTWDNGIPAAGDTVIIQAGDTVTIDVNTASIDSLYIANTGVLRFGSNTGSFILNVDNSSTSDIVNDGTIDANDAAFAQHTIDISGTFDNTNGTFNGDQTGGANLEAINVNYNGTGTMQSIGPATYYILRQNGSGSLSTDSNNLVIRSLLLQSGSFTAGTGNLTIEGDSLSIQGTSFDVLTNSSSIIFQGSTSPTINVNGSNIDTLDLYNLTITGADATLLASNASVNLRINNNLTLTDQDLLFAAGGQTESISYGTNGSVLYNGSSAQTTGEEWTNSVNPVNVTINNANDVTISGTGSAGDRTLSGDLILTNGELRHSATGRTLTVNGDVVGGSGAYGQTDNCTLVLNGSLNQNVTVSNSFDLHNLTINKTFGSTVLVTVQTGASINTDANSTLRVQQGTLRFSTTTQLNPGTNNTLQIDANGILETGGTSLAGFSTYNTSSGTVVFSGSTLETLPTGSPLTIGTVEINNSANAQTSNGTLVVSDSLVLTNGRITTTTSNILKLDLSATIGGSPSSSSMVVGPLQKEFNSTNTDSFVYAIGSSTNYRPAAFNYTAYTGSGTSVIEIEHSTGSFTPKTLPSGINEIDTDSHYLVRERGTAPTSFTYTYSGTFNDGNFNPESRNNILVETSTSYTTGQDTVIQATNVVVGSGFTALPTGLGFRVVFGASTVSQITWDNGGTGNSWFTAANWNPDGVPTSSDNVVISGAYTINIDAGAAQCSTLTVGDGANRVTLTVSTTTDSLQIFSNSSTALTVSDNSILALPSEGVVDFSPTVVASYDAANTNYTSASIVEYQGGSVNVDTYGDLVINGATASTGTGTIVTNGDLKKQGTSTFTSSNNFTVNGDSVLISAGTFGLGSTTLSFNGVDFQISGTAQLSSGTGTVSMTGTNSQTISDNSTNTLTFNDLTINKSSNNITLSDSIIVNGTLTLTSGLLNTTNTNKIRIGSSGSISGGSASSYVDGPLAHTGTGNKIFPLGDQGDYRPIEVNTSFGTAPIIRFEMVSTNPGGTAGSGLNNISTIRYWNGSVIGGSFVVGTVKLYWGSNDGVDGALSDLRVATSTTVNGTYSSSGNNGTTGNSSSGTVTSFPLIAIQFFTLGSAAGDNSLPVSLTSFTANAEFSQITLNWLTESEIDNQGFNIYRATESNPDNWVTINQELIPGAGNTSAKTSYEFVDQLIQSGETYYYQLESISYNGVRELFTESTVTIAAPVPTKFALLNNYPNPFNPVTNIKFQVPDQSEVTVVVYDIQGNLVKKLLTKATYSAGEHVAQWDATDQNGVKVSTGVYFYQFVSGDFQKFGKMMLIK